MKKITLLNIANTLLMMVGILHIVTHFTSEPEGSTLEQRELIDNMKSIGFSMPGGEVRTMLEVMTGYGFIWAILLICLALIGFFTGKSKTLLYLLSFSCFASAIPMFTHLIAPPGVMLIVSSLMYAVAAYRLKSVH
jgi:hypothetical protein